MTKRVIAFVIDGCFIGLMAVFLSNYISVDKTIVATAVSTIICMSVMECSNRHGSLGKIIMGLVVTAGDNDEISMLDGWTRNVLKFLPAMLVGVFYDTGIDTVFLIIQLVFIALPFCNKRRIAFHDAIAGTHVTKYIKKNSCSNMDKEDVCANELILKGVSGEFGNMELPVKETLIFGRDEKSCNFVFNSAARGVSRIK